MAKAHLKEKRKRRIGRFQANFVDSKVQLLFISWGVGVSCFSILLGHFMSSSIGLAILVLLLNVVFGLFVSHIVAGPVHNFKSTISSILEEKKLRKMLLRKDEVFPDLQVNFNFLVSFIENNYVENKEKSDKKADH